VTPSLLDLSQTVLVPVSAFTRSVVAVPSSTCFHRKVVVLYHPAAVSQGTTARWYSMALIAPMALRGYSPLTAT
jgi:hypothetical protein